MDFQYHSLTHYGLDNLEPVDWLQSTSREVRSQESFSTVHTLLSITTAKVWVN